MHDDQAAREFRRRLLDLQAALFDLRRQLCRLSVTLQEQAHALEDPPAPSAEAEAAALMQRLRRRR